MEARLLSSNWLRYTQLLDSALPVGAFSHSFGLESYVQHGCLQSLTDVKRYCEAMLYQLWSTSDAMAIKAVYKYGDSGDWDRIWELDRLLHVSRVAYESREGVRKIGRRLWKLGQSLFPELNWQPMQEAYDDGRAVLTVPVVHGWIARGLGIPLDQTAEGYLYTCCAASVNAAIRLMSIGQTEGQRTLTELLPTIREAWELSKGMDPYDMYANSFAAEIEMCRHERLYSRLFMS